MTSESMLSETKKRNYFAAHFKFSVTVIMVFGARKVYKNFIEQNKDQTRMVSLDQLHMVRLGKVLAHIHV